MHVGIQGWGSEGDVRPLIALAARLRHEGHEPQLVLTPIDGRDYREECRGLDVPLRVEPENLGFSLETLAQSARSSDPSKLSRAVLDLGFTPHVEAMYAAAIDLCGDSDVVVGGSSSWYVKAAALKVGIPYVAVDYYYCAEFLGPEEGGKPPLAVRCADLHSHRATAFSGADGAEARVGDLEVRGPGEEAAEHVARQIVPSVAAAVIPARQREEGRCRIHHDDSHVLRVGVRGPSTIRDLEAQRRQGRDPLLEPGRLLLALEALRKAQSSFGPSARLHEHVVEQRNHRHAPALLPRPGSDRAPGERCATPSR
jgi:hypothetical protein